MAESGPTGRRIRTYRRRLGLTQEVLAGRAGVSPSWLSQVERGVRSGGLRTLLPVAEVLGVDLATLVETPRKRVPGPSTLLQAGEEHAEQWIAADRSSAAARRAGDLVVAALADEARSRVYAHAGWVTDARDVLARAIDTLAPAAEGPEQPAGPWLSPEAAALWGSLLLSAAHWAARANDRTESHRLLGRAEATVTRVQRDDELFGCTDTAVFRVGCAVELGDLADAVRLGTSIETSHLHTFTRTRPTALRVRIAQVHERRGQDADALLWLTEAERLGPEWVYGWSEVRDMVGVMLRRERGRRPGLRELADRVGVLE